MTRPEISMVISCHFEEKSIDEFYRRLRKTLDDTGSSHEIIFVNDGSTDGTLARLRAIHAKDPHVTVVDLYRNAGQACALTAGIERAEGEIVGFLDSDLQLDPEELPSLLQAMDSTCDVVSGARRERKDPWLRRSFSFLANRIIRRMTGHKITDFGCTFKLYRAGLIRAHDPGPRNPLQQAIVLRSARRIQEVPVTHHPRRYGRSGWSLRRLFALNLDHVLAASEGVFQMLSIVAFLIAALTFLRILLAWVLPGSVLGAPITTGLILNALLLATAFLVSVLALVGEYAIRTYTREHGGPQYVVREVLPRRAGEASKA